MNGYKIVLLKAILCFIGCRKVNGYAPEYVPFQVAVLSIIYFCILNLYTELSKNPNATGKITPREKENPKQ